MRILLLISGFFLIAACKKQNNLDVLAFPAEKLDSYQLEAYDAGDIVIPDEFKIDPSMRTLVSYPSYDESTGETYTIYGVYIGDTSNISSDSIIMYCHGQSKHMDLYWNRATVLANLIEKHHFGIFMMDYRGYGMSEGEPDEQALYEDVDASIDWLKNRGAQSEKTFFYGFSLGCIPAIERTAFREDFKPAKLIIEAPLASVQNLAQSSTLINIDTHFITTLEFNNAENIKSVSVPLLWMHGIEDDYIAIENGELIYANHGGSYKEAVRVEGANHSEIPQTLGIDVYSQILVDFITK